MSFARFRSKKGVTALTNRDFVRTAVNAENHGSSRNVFGTSLGQVTVSLSKEAHFSATAGAGGSCCQVRHQAVAEGRA